MKREKHTHTRTHTQENKEWLWDSSYETVNNSMSECNWSIRRKIKREREEMWKIQNGIFQHASIDILSICYIHMYKIQYGLISNSIIKEIEILWNWQIRELVICNNTIFKQFEK